MLNVPSVDGRERKREDEAALAEVPDYCVRTDNKLRPRVPLVIGNIVVCLKPDPLLTLSQETVVA